MEQQPSNTNKNPLRKMRFAPKAPPRRVPKAEVKTEAVEDNDAVQARDLLQRFNQASAKSKVKAEKKVAPAQVAFGYGSGSMSFKSPGVPKDASTKGRDQYSFYGGESTPRHAQKEYKEPWDYYSDYPVSLPLRRPYSGNPEVLNEEEFGEGTETMTFNGNLVNPAAELGLMEENLEPTMFFIQLPSTLPVIKKPAISDDQQVDSNSNPPGSVQPCKLKELPAGFMGKMLVYKSGIVKLKLGDTLYDVNPGLRCAFSQNVAAINTDEKHCCSIGEINKRIIIEPDVDFILNRMADL